MALSENPNLALIPSGYKSGKIYSVLPTSGVGDFDFSRSGTATRINSQGLIETVADGVPRLNYPLIDGKVVGCPSHLLENSATNLIPYSEDFTQWAIQSATITANNEISPDGTLNADKFTRTAINNNLRFINSISGNYTFSVFLKADTKNWALLYINYSGGTDGQVYVDLENGVIGTTIGTDNEIKDFGNGWFKVSVTFTTPAALSDVRIVIADGDGVISGSDGSIYIFGGQLEAGSYDTSYIPTNGSIATRSAETANNSGDASTFNDSEGVLMAEIDVVADGTEKWISISDGSVTNRIILYISSSNTLRTFVGASGTQVDMNEVVNLDSYNKIAFKYKQDDFALWVNGIEIETDVNGNTPSNLSVLNLSSSSGLLNPFYGNTKQIQYFDSALNDSELEKLTSWVSFTDMAEGQLYSIE